MFSLSERGIAALSSSTSTRQTSSEKQRKAKLVLALAAASAAAGLSVATQVSAANVTWDGGGANDNWTTGQNWASDVAPVAGDILFFDGSARPTPFNNNPAGTPFGGITFNAGASAFTLGGAGITLGSGYTTMTNPVTSVGTIIEPIPGGIINNSANLQTISFSSPLVLGMFSHAISGGSGGLALNMGPGGITRATGAGAVFSGTVTTNSLTNTNGIIGPWATVGNDWATVNGGQVVAYTGYTDLAATFTAPATVATQNYRWGTNPATGGNSSFGTAATSVTEMNTFQYSQVNAVRTLTISGTLRTNGISKTDSSAGTTGIITINGGSITSGSGELVVFSNSITPDVNGIVFGSTLADNGAQPVSLIKTGNAAIQINNASTYTGGSYVLSGRLRGNNASSFGTGPIFVSPGAQIYLAAGGTFTNDITLSGFAFAEGSPTFSGGAMRLASANAVAAGQITLAGDARIGARGTSATTNAQITGKITGNYSLEFGATNTASTIVITNPANDWGGNTTINLGTLRVGGTGEVIPSGAGKGNVFIFGDVNNAVNSALDVGGKTETINGLFSGGDLSKAVVNNSVGSGTIAFGDNNTTAQYDGRFENAGGTLNITKIGSGVQTLTGGGNNYTGATTVTGGTLLLSGSANINSSSLIDVRTGGTLDVTAIGGINVQGNQTLAGGGTVRGNVTHTDGNANLAPGGIGTAGTLTLANDLTLGGGNVRVDLGATPTVGAGVNDLVQVNGNLNFSGTPNLVINRTAGNLGAGSYVIAKYNTLTGTPAFNLPTVRQSLSVNASGGNVNLVVGAGAPLSLTWSGTTGNAWDINNTLNWNTASQKFFDWDSVTFDDTGSDPNPSINTTVQPTTVTFANTTAKAYNIGGGNPMVNVNNLNKTGNGIATLSNGGNNLISNTTVSAGTLVAQNTTVFSNLTVNGGTMQVNGGNVLISAGTVNAGGDIVFTGGQGSFSSLVINSGGTMTLGNGGDPRGSVTNNGDVVIETNDGLTYDATFTISGTGTLRKTGTGATQINGVNTYTGNTILAAGRTLPNTSNAFGDTTVAGGSVSVSAGAAIDLSNATAANALNFGRKQFFVVGSGDGSGVLKNDNATNGQQNAFQLITLTGDATFGGSGRWDMRAAQVGGVNQATLTLNNNTLTKTGAGSFILVNTSVTDGNINLSQGIMQFESTTSIPASATGKTITMAGGTTLQFFTLTGDVSRQINTTGDATMGTNTNNAPGSTLASPIQLGGNLNLGPVNANGTGTLTLAGNITETGGARTVTKTINGTGTTSLVILSGNNSYTGNTNVSGGTLRVNGTHTAASTIADYNVSGGATFGGSSSNINAKIIMPGGSNLSPGANTATVGTLNVGTLSLDGTNLQYDIEASGADKTNVTTSGGLLLGGGANQFTFASVNPATVANGTYTLIDYSGSPLADLSKFSITNATGLGSLNFTLVNNTAGTSIDLTVTGGVSISNSTWNVDASGNWSVAGNWTGGVPNSVDATANFGTVITAPRTVTVDSAQTVGTINFSSPNSYTIGGASVLSLDVSTGAAAINVTAGSHTISAPVTLNDNLTVTSSASSGVALTGALTATGKTITKAGAGTVQFENVRATALNISAGSAKISAKGTPNSAAGTSVVSSLTIASGANLDLTNNSAVIDYTGPVGTLVGDVRQHLQSGRLSSSSADANRKLGYGDNALLNKSTFAGQSVDTSSVLIKYTYAGDANLDGQVDVTDLGSLATNWQTSNVWTGGDFNYDGFVDVTDLGSLATNWQAGVGSPLGRQSFQDAMAAVGLGNVSVPEPTSIGLVGVSLATLLARRRRRA